MPPTFTDEGVKAALQVRERVPGTAVLIVSQYVEETLRRRAAGRRPGRRRLPAEGPHRRRARVRRRGRARRRRRDRDGPGGRRTARSRHRRDDGPLDELTPREREVLELMAEGRSNAAIAARAGRHRRRRREAHLVDLRQARPRRRTPTTAGCWRCWRTSRAERSPHEPVLTCPLHPLSLHSPPSPGPPPSTSTLRHRPLAPPCRPPTSPSPSPSPKQPLDGRFHEIRGCDGSRWVDAGRRAVSKPMLVALARRRVAPSAAQRARRAASVEATI